VAQLTKQEIYPPTRHLVALPASEMIRAPEQQDYPDHAALAMALKQVILLAPETIKAPAEQRHSSRRHRPR
jgi:hypothetical protein